MTPVVRGNTTNGGPPASGGRALQAIKSLVLDSVRSPHTRRAYDRVLSEFLAWCISVEGAFTKATVQRYRAELEGRGLSASAINVQLAAIRKLPPRRPTTGFFRRSSPPASPKSRAPGPKDRGQGTG